PTRPEDWLQVHPAESSRAIRRRVTQARQRDGTDTPPNSRLTPAQLQTRVRIEASDNQYIQIIISQGLVSARSLSRWQKVACTIADLEGSNHITRHHLQEALFFKQHNILDREPQRLVTSSH